MSFVKLWHLSTDVQAHILVVNKEMAALSPKKYDGLHPHRTGCYPKLRTKK